MIHENGILFFRIWRLWRTENTQAIVMLINSVEVKRFVDFSNAWGITLWCTLQTWNQETKSLYIVSTVIGLRHWYKRETYLNGGSQNVKTEVHERYLGRNEWKTWKNLGLNGIIRTHAILVQCSTNWAVKLTGSYPGCQRLVLAWILRDFVAYRGRGFAA